MVPQFKEVLQRMNQIHERKNTDYAVKGDPFENFDKSSVIGDWYDHPTHKVFAILIGTKLTRIATLLNSKNKPNHESIEDSFLDLCTYCVLWMCWYLDDSKTV